MAKASRNWFEWPVFAGMLSLLYPDQCGLCGEENADAICPKCGGLLRRLDKVSKYENSVLDAAGALFHYEGAGKLAVTRLKFERVTPLASEMGALLAEFAERSEFGAVDMFVPVPIHWSRRFQRGFNQSELISEAFGADRVDSGLLKRIRRTQPQTSLSAKERTKNLADAFEVTRPLNGESIALIDDVQTSGATLLECARKLKSVGAGRVVGITFAGVP